VHVFWAQTVSYLELMEDVRTPLMVSFPQYWNGADGHISARVGEGGWSFSFNPAKCAAIELRTEHVMCTRMR
jgi:hypothetical protein